MHKIACCKNRHSKESAFRWITFAVLMTADRAAKLLAVFYLNKAMIGENVRLFSLSLHHNQSISFSMLKNLPSISLAASIVGTVIFGILCLKNASLCSSTGVLFLWAGAIGNLIDRLLYGYVIDWLYIGIYINLADIWLCVGCLIIFFQYAESSA